jgi:hypothetical protein
MGQIVRKIKDILFEKYFRTSGDGDTLPPLIVVLGDHGMADVGGHGGATPAEIFVPVVAISPRLKQLQARFFSKMLLYFIEYNAHMSIVRT